MRAKDQHTKLVYTIRDRCRVCYTCIRECPIKGIRIVNGQAEVMPERCIGCGNCTRVCSQGAKAYRKSIAEVTDLLNQPGLKAALIAPSFIAEFEEISDYKQLVGMIRALGFDLVNEVSFGADIVATAYERLLQEDENHYITSDCPAIVSYVEKYMPELTHSLAPVISPVMATARVLHKKYGDELKTVFIGPCIAKKSESDEIDETLTFQELREMLEAAAIKPDNTVPVDFSPPHGGKGSVFPISRGLLQTIRIEDSVLTGNDIIVAEGRVNFQEALREYQEGQIGSQHLELLCCDGCIMGPGMTPKGKLYNRRTLVNRYVKQKLDHYDHQQWEKDIAEFSSIDLTRSFDSLDQKLEMPEEEAISRVLQTMGKFSEKDHLNCGACGYDTCRNHAIAIIRGLAEIDMCLPHTIERLHHSVDDLAVSNEKLVSMQQTLKQTEKLAHMGQLSAGIAHELNNPLGVVIMYSNILLEECKEGSQLYNDLRLVAQQAERCKKIVGGLLNFARKNQVNNSMVDIHELIDQSLNAVIIPPSVKLVRKSDVADSLVELDAEQMIQVVSNLIKNAVEAMPEGGQLTIGPEETKQEISILISDTGTGISQEDLDKIFEPFFTTKTIGKGTGLGLATAYGIVKMHKGKITVTSNNDQGKGPTGTTFKISLSKNRKHLN